MKITAVDTVFLEDSWITWYILLRDYSECVYQRMYVKLYSEKFVSFDTWSILEANVESFDKLYDNPAILWRRSE